NNLTFIFNNPYEINTGSETIYINSLQKRETNNNINSSFSASVTTEGKTFNKRKVKLKGGDATSYQEIVADPGDIYYPNDADGNMYSAYAEVTNYVKTHGTGDYYVADIALRE